MICQEEEVPEEVKGVEEKVPEEEVDAGEAGICSWARHLTSSVGVETTQVARPPTAPASQVVSRLLPRAWSPP